PGVAGWAVARGVAPSMVGVGIAAGLSRPLLLVLRHRDPRRLRTGLVLLVAVLSSASLLALLAPWGLSAGAALLLVVGALGLIGTLTLGLTVVIGSFAVSRQESGALGRVLSGLGGIALLSAPWGTAALAGSDSALGTPAA